MSTVTWNKWLDAYCRRMTADEKTQFRTTLQVSQQTVNRWRRGEDSPNATNLEQLLSILPEEQREQLLLLVRKDLRLWSIVPAALQENQPLEELEEEEKQVSLFQLGILDSFALKILRMRRGAHDRFYEVSSAVLRKCVDTLETRPARTGIEVIVAKCMPPRDGKVRSLRRLAAMGTPPWRGDRHPLEYFWGVNSLAGYVVTERHGEMIPDLKESTLPIPAQVEEHARSVAAVPLMCEKEVAGVLLVCAASTDFFTDERMRLIEIFADLMCLAFSDSAFYPLSHIELGLMPPLTYQKDYFSTFQERVESVYRQAVHEESTSMRELEGIDEIVRNQIEEELLARAVIAEVKK